MPLPFPVSAWGSSGPFNGQVSTTNLISYWKLNAGSSGSNEADSTPTGNTAIENNSPGVVAGKISGARSFNGANQYFDVVDNAGLRTGGTDFAITAWFLTNNNTSGAFEIMSKTNTTPNLEYELRYTPGNGVLIVAGNGGSGVAATQNPTINTATWYWLYAEWDNTAFKSGISINNAALTQSSAGSTGSISVTSNPLIGAAVPASPSFFWNGDICEVSFWKRKLTSGERTALYNGGNGLTY